MRCPVIPPRWSGTSLPCSTSTTVTPSNTREGVTAAGCCALTVAKRPPARRSVAAPTADDAPPLSHVQACASRPPYEQPPSQLILLSFSLNQEIRQHNRDHRLQRRRQRA